MSGHSESAASGPVTYSIGAVAAAMSQLSANDWLVYLSVILVGMRIIFELNDFIQRRADRRAKKAEEIRARMFAEKPPESGEL